MSKEATGIVWRWTLTQKVVALSENDAENGMLNYLSHTGEGESKSDILRIYSRGKLVRLPLRKVNHDTG